MVTVIRTVSAALSIAVCEGLLRIGGFRALRGLVQVFPTCGAQNPSQIPVLMEAFDKAVDRVMPFAAIRTYCLSRSAAVVCLLRLSGVPASLAIGVRHYPFAAHAWIEVGGQVFADPLETVEGYSVLERI